MPQSSAFLHPVSRPRLLHCQPGRQTPDLLYLPRPPGPPCPMHLSQHRESISLPLPSRYLERTPDAACGCTYRKEAWSCSRTRQTKTQGTQAGRCHRDPQASEMVFLKVRGQMESPSLTHKAAQVLMSIINCSDFRVCKMGNEMR